MKKFSSFIILFFLFTFQSYSFEIDRAWNKDIHTFYELKKKAANQHKGNSFVIHEMMGYYSAEYSKEPEILAKRLLDNTNLLESSTEDFVVHSMIALQLLITSNDRLMLTPLTNKLENKAKLIKDQQLSADVEIFLGAYFQFLDDYNKSQLHFFRALEFSKNLKDKHYSQSNYFNIALTYYYQKKYNDAERYLVKALEYEKYGLTEGHLNKMMLLSGIEEGRGNVEKALEILVQLEKDVPDNIKGSFYTNLGQLYITSFQWNKAEPILLKAKDILEAENSVGLFNVYSNLALCYSKLNNFEKSYKYELLKEKILKQQKKQESLLALERIKKQELLKNQRIEKTIASEKLKIEQSKTIQLVIVLAFVFVLLTISVVFIVRINRKNRFLVKMSLEKMSHPTFIEDTQESELIEKKISLVLVEKFEKAFYEKELYKDPDLTIQKLAKKLSTNVKDLSQTINGHYHVPFRNLVNEKRVDLAKKLLLDKRYENYSMEGIAETVGYKNKSMFYLHFKNLTGVTPANFQSHALVLMRNADETDTQTMEEIE
jgi:tetratricopeptide (TPR) repeat protein/AraC-like DNA-binding protein